MINNIKNINSKYNTVKQSKNELEYLDNFDWIKYIKSYVDLKHINNEFDAKKHWISCGKKENRKYFIINNTIENTDNTIENIDNTIENIDNDSNINNITNKIKRDFQKIILIGKNI
jgi:hypothetical protein